MNSQDFPKDGDSLPSGASSPAWLPPVRFSQAAAPAPPAGPGKLDPEQQAAARLKSGPESISTFQSASPSQATNQNQDIRAENVSPVADGSEILEHLHRISDCLETLSECFQKGNNPSAEHRSCMESDRRIPPHPFLVFYDSLRCIVENSGNPPPLPEESVSANAAVEQALKPWKDERLRLRDSLLQLDKQALELLRGAGIERMAVERHFFDSSSMVVGEFVEDYSLPEGSVAFEICPGWRDAATGAILRQAKVAVVRTAQRPPPLEKSAPDFQVS